MRETVRTKLERKVPQRRPFVRALGRRLRSIGKLEEAPSRNLFRVQERIPGVIQLYAYKISNGDPVVRDKLGPAENGR